MVQETYTPTGYPQDNDPIVAANFREDFRRIRNAINQHTTTEHAVAGTHWFGQDSEPAQSGINQYAITLQNEAEALSFEDGYPQGMMVWFEPKQDNTSGAGLSVNGGRSLRVVGSDGEPVTARTLQVGALMGVMQHRGQWKIISREAVLNQLPQATVVQLELEYDLQNAADKQFHTIYSDLQEWKKYDEVVFFVDTKSGRRVGSVPRNALPDFGSSPPTTQGSVNVLGNSPGQDESPFIWLAIQDGTLKASIDGAEVTDAVAAHGRAVASYFDSSAADGWTPSIRVYEDDRQHVVYQWLVLQGYNHGASGANENSRPTDAPAILSPDGGFHPVSGTDPRHSQFAPNLAFASHGNRDHVVEVQLSDFEQQGSTNIWQHEFSPYASGPTAAGSVQNTIQHSGIVVRWSGTALGANVGQNLMWPTTASVWTRHWVVYVPPPGSNADEIRRAMQARESFTIRNATPLPITVAPSIRYVTYTLNTVQQKFETGKAFVVPAGGARFLYPTYRIVGQSPQPIWVSWYSVDGPTELSARFNPTQIPFSSSGVSVDRLGDQAGVINWSGIERFIWAPGAVTGINEPQGQHNTTNMQWVGHPLWGKVWVRNDHLRPIKVYARYKDLSESRGTVIEFGENRLIDFSARQAPFDLT